MDVKVEPEDGNALQGADLVDNLNDDVAENSPEDVKAEKGYDFENRDAAADVQMEKEYDLENGELAEDVQTEKEYDLENGEFAEDVKDEKEYDLEDGELAEQTGPSLESIGFDLDETGLDEFNEPDDWYADGGPLEYGGEDDGGVEIKKHFEGEELVDEEELGDEEGLAYEEDSANEEDLGEEEELEEGEIVSGEESGEEEETEEDEYPVLEIHHKREDYENEEDQSDEEEAEEEEVEDITSSQFQEQPCVKEESEELVCYPDGRAVPKHLRDRQREIREKFKENVQEFLKQELSESMNEEKLEKNTVSAYELDCASSGHISVPSELSTKASSVDTSQPIEFSTAGKNYQMEDRLTLSEVFELKQGKDHVDRVYGFSSKSQDFVKAHPDFVTAGPNPLKIPHSEIMNVLNGLSNVYLAHEISINPDFRLEHNKPSEDSLTERVKIQMTKAFWDIFDEQLKKKPPNYNQALSVFKEVKENMFLVLLPHNHQMRNRIDTTLDLAHVKHSIKHDTLTKQEFQNYTDFIVETLAKLCCPTRDAAIAAIKKLDKPSEVFKAILEVMDDMKLDMANFYVMQFRPSIVAHCAEAERMKLAEYIEQEYQLKSDGLGSTRKWLLRHRLDNRDEDLVLARAYAELLNYTRIEDFPETILLDSDRCRRLHYEATRHSIVGAITLTVSAVALSYFNPLPNDFRATLKKYMFILITVDDVSDQKKFEESIEKAAEQCYFVVDEMVKKEVKRRLSEDEKNAVRTCVREIAKPDHKIRSLLFRRIIDHATTVAVAKVYKDVVVPTSLTSLTPELTVTMAAFRRLTTHNSQVYSDIYAGILSNKLPFLKFPCKPEDPWDCTLIETLKMLRKTIVKCPGEGDCHPAARSAVNESETESRAQAPQTPEKVEQVETEVEVEVEEKPRRCGDMKYEKKEENESAEVPQIPTPYVKQTRAPGKRATIVPRFMPRRYVLQSAADGLARLVPNLEPSKGDRKPELKKKKKKAKMQRVNEETRRRRLKEEFENSPREVLWSKIEEKELQGFCGKEPTRLVHAPQPESKQKP